MLKRDRLQRAAAFIRLIWLKNFPAVSYPTKIPITIRKPMKFLAFIDFFACLHSVLEVLVQNQSK